MPAPAFLFGLVIEETEGKIRRDDRLDLNYRTGTALFRSISGLTSKSDVQNYAEGGVTGFTRKIIGGRTWDNLVLKQGFTGDTTLFMWKWRPRRVDGFIVQLGPRGDGSLREISRWRFKRGYPIKWEGPDFDANRNELAIETIEIAHHGLEWVDPSPPETPPPPQPPPPPPVLEPAEAQFQSGSSSLVPPQDQLDRIAGELIADRNRRVRVDGHTDHVGTWQSNKTLSQQRAESTAKYLIAQGVDPKQITVTAGHSWDQPLVEPETCEGERKLNRRVIVTPV